MDPNDRSLVVAAQRELPYVTASFEALARRYYPFVRSVARQVVVDADDADTVSQDAMLRVFHHLVDLRDVATFEGWLRRITVNAARSHLAREAREREKAQRLHVAREGGGGSQARADEGALFAQLLGCLSLEERTILAHRFVGDLELGEIARRTGARLSATKMRYYRALKKLRPMIPHSLDPSEFGLEGVLRKS